LKPRRNHPFCESEVHYLPRHFPHPAMAAAPAIPNLSNERIVQQ
jgi:hypothetical protein